ncbi:hypothetical protein O4H61_03450 [Roseovarius aestuarii]|nr:hypothetical protein [Roseovarius aestuarii]
MTDPHKTARALIALACASTPDLPEAERALGHAFIALINQNTPDITTEEIRGLLGILEPGATQILAALLAEIDSRDTQAIRMAGMQ